MAGRRSEPQIAQVQQQRFERLGADLGVAFESGGDSPASAVEPEDLKGARAAGSTSQAWRTP